MENGLEGIQTKVMNSWHSEKKSKEIDEMDIRNTAKGTLKGLGDC